MAPPLDSFLGVKPELVIVNDQVDSWINKRYPGSSKKITRKTIQFATDLFLSWEDESPSDGGKFVKVSHKYLTSFNLFQNYRST